MENAAVQRTYVELQPLYPMKKRQKHYTRDASLLTSVSSFWKSYGLELRLLFFACSCSIFIDIVIKLSWDVRHAPLILEVKNLIFGIFRVTSVSSPAGEIFNCKLLMEKHLQHQKDLFTISLISKRPSTVSGTRVYGMSWKHTTSTVDL